MVCVVAPVTSMDTTQSCILGHCVYGCVVFRTLLPLYPSGAVQCMHLALIDDLSDICICPEMPFSCRVCPPADENVNPLNWQVFPSLPVSARRVMTEQAGGVISV